MPEDRRARFVFKSLISKLHEFVSETKCVHRPSPSIEFMNVFLGMPFLCFSSGCRSITTEEWKSGIEFLTRMGEAPTTPSRQFAIFSGVFGVSALVERINNPSVRNATESTLLGPFFTEDAPDRAYNRPLNLPTSPFTFSLQFNSASRSRLRE